MLPCELFFIFVILFVVLADFFTGLIIVFMRLFIVVLAGSFISLISFLECLLVGLPSALSANTGIATSDNKNSNSTLINKILVFIPILP